MKKFLIIVFFLLGAHALSAQDTVRYPDRWYGYTPRGPLMEYDSLEWDRGSLRESWFTQTRIYEPCSHPNPNVHLGQDSTILLMREVESGVGQRMYGIAVTMDPDDFDTISAHLVVYRGVTMTPVPPSSVVPGLQLQFRYDATVDSIIPIPFHEPLRKECVFEYDLSLPTVRSVYSNCYEFYFDEPIDLTTSNTYIGITRCGFDPYKMNMARETSRSQAWYMVTRDDDETPFTFQDFMFYGNILTGSVNSAFKYILYYTQPGYEDAYWYDCYWGMIFPILSPRCTAPKNLHIARSEKKDTAIWRGDPESDIFQVSLTGYPASPDSGSIVTVTDTSYLLPDTLPDTVCVAYVRKMCTFEFATHTDTVWGDWSAPIVVAGDTTGLGIDTTGSGIDTTGTGGDTLSIARADLQQGIILTPNPASGTVTVRSAERMTEIEVLDIVGNKMMTHKASGLTTKLDVATLPRGTYIVRIHTPMGTASRKLILK